jgi:hypothetical protein
MLFFVKHILIICIHFVLLIKSGSVVSKRSTPYRLNACPQRGQGKELGLDLVSLKEKISQTPKRPLMAGEKKDDGIGDPFKMFLEESFMQ